MAMRRGSVDAYGMTELHRSLRDGKNVEEVRKILRRRWKDAARPDMRGMLPLHWAAVEKVPLDVFLTILAAYPEAVWIPDNSGMFPMHWAACGETRKMVREHTAAALERKGPTRKIGILAKFGCFGAMPTDENISRRKSQNLASTATQSTGKACTPEEFASTCHWWWGSPRRTNKQLYARSCSREMQGRKKPTSFCKILELIEKKSEHMEGTIQQKIIQCLCMLHPAGLVQQSTSQGCLPLHIAAASQCSAATLKMLISMSPESCSSKNVNRWTPIHCMARNGASFDAMSVLAEAHPAALAMKDSCGMLPLHVAVANGGATETIQILVERFPDGPKRTDCFGMLPLHLAIECGNPLATLQLLFHANPDGAKQPDSEGLLPLHMAIHFGAPAAFVQQLVSYFPEALLQQDKSGMTCLHHAVLQNCPMDMIRLLLDKEPKAVQLADNNNLLPIHLADCPEIAAFLYPRTPLGYLLRGTLDECKEDFLNIYYPSKRTGADFIKKLNRQFVREMSDALNSLLPSEVVHACIAPLLVYHA